MYILHAFTQLSTEANFSSNKLVFVFHTCTLTIRVKLNNDNHGRIKLKKM